jgi:protein-disulfide isomerase
VPKVRALLVLRAAALVALLGSSALTIDYLSPVPSYCGASSGCGVVQHSGWGYLGAARIPLPALGLVGFTALFTLSLLPGTRRFVAAPVALAGGLAAAALLAVQWLAIGAFCILCVTVDSAALVAALAAAAFLWWPEPKSASEGAATDANASAPPSSSAPREPLHDGAWIALGALAVLAPLVWPSVRPAADVPREIAAYHQPGKINVIEFVDFECPFCRMYHPELKKVVDEFGPRVNFVRLDLPLAMHPRARGAARAHLCAVAKGRGEALADALMQTEDLSEQNLVRVGAKVGLDASELERCMKDPATDKAAGENEAMLTRLGLLEGLPTTFIGAKMLVGAALAPELREAFEQALVGPQRGIPAPMYVALCVLLAAASVAGGWYLKRRKDGAPLASVS